MPTKSASTPRLTQCTAFAVPPLIANICSNAKALPTSRQRDGAVDLHARSVVPLKVRCPPKMSDHPHCDTVRFVDVALPFCKDHTTGLCRFSVILLFVWARTWSTLSVSCRWPIGPCLMLAVQLQKGYIVDEVAASQTSIVCTHANRLLLSLVGLEELTRHLSCAQVCGRPPEPRSSGGCGGFGGFGGAHSSYRPSPLLTGRRASPRRRPVAGSFVVAAAAQARPSWFRSPLQAHRVRSWAPLGQGEGPRVQHLRRRTFNCISADDMRGAKISVSAYRSAKRSSSAASAIVKALWSDKWKFAAIAQQLQARINKLCCP
jgi:hypothetical protein